MSPREEPINAWLARSMEIALSCKTDPALRIAAEAVASAILGGADMVTIRQEAILILRAEECDIDVTLVDAVLDRARLN